MAKVQRPKQPKVRWAEALLARLRGQKLLLAIPVEERVPSFAPQQALESQGADLCRPHRGSDTEAGSTVESPNLTIAELATSVQKCRGCRAAAGSGMSALLLKLLQRLNLPKEWVSGAVLLTDEKSATRFAQEQ